MSALGEPVMLSYEGLGELFCHVVISYVKEF